MRKNRNYWTKERCIEEAAKYKLRSVFKAKSGGAYNASIKNGWLKEICSHMSISGNKFRRLVYVYEFENKVVYVGLTYNIEERDKKHKRHNKSGVFKYMNKTGLKPKLSYSDYIDVELAKKLEGEKIEYYKNAGYNVLNIAEAGAVGGGNLKWTKEKCLEEARKYKKRTKFAKESNSAYNSARNNGWLEEVCSHMIKIDKLPKGYWTKEKCGEEALKYKTKKELIENSSGAYLAMVKNKWLLELCSHLKNQKSNGYWTKEVCVKEALTYSSKEEFRKNNESAYVTASKNKWLSEICFENKKNNICELY